MKKPGLLGSAFAVLVFPALLSGQTVVYGSGATVTNGGLGEVENSACNTLTNVWCEVSVRNGGEVGINGTYPRNGNGSVFLSTNGMTAKADFRYLFETPFALSALESFGYDFYRDPNYGTVGVQVPAMRFLITNGTTFGSLAYEPVYNSGPTGAGSWETIAGGTDSFLWLYLGGGCGVYENYGISLGTWQTTGHAHSGGCANVVVDGTWTVYGMNVGVGSGWAQTFHGAVDNVNYKLVGQGAQSFNFEVGGQSVVPEPSTWLLMAAGLGGLVAIRRRTAR